MVRESKITYEIEVRRLDEAQKELDKVHTRVCKKVMDILSCAASGFAEMELGRQTVRLAHIGHVIKY
jgi:hypothetical protein